MRSKEAKETLFKETLFTSSLRLSYGLMHQHVHEYVYVKKGSGRSKPGSSVVLQLLDWWRRLPMPHRRQMHRGAERNTTAS